MARYKGHKVYMNGKYPACINRVFKGKPKQSNGYKFVRVGK